MPFALTKTLFPSTTHLSVVSEDLETASFWLLACSRHLSGARGCCVTVVASMRLLLPPTPIGTWLLIVNAVSCVSAHVWSDCTNTHVNYQYTNKHKTYVTWSPLCVAYVVWWVAGCTPCLVVGLKKALGECWVLLMLLKISSLFRTNVASQMFWLSVTSKPPQCVSTREKIHSAHRESAVLGGARSENCTFPITSWILVYYYGT